MTDIFRPNLQFESLVADLRRTSSAFAPVSITEAFRERLVAEVETLEWIEERRDDTLTFSYESCEIHYPIEGHPAISELGLALAWQLRLHKGLVKNLAQWLPNQAKVQRYRGESDGIGPHRDFARDRYLVAVFTITGYGRFEVLAEEDHPFGRTYETGPGSLTLLEAAGLSDGSDWRPQHQALPPPCGQRISIAYRMMR